MKREIIIRKQGNEIKENFNIGKLLGDYVAVCSYGILPLVNDIVKDIKDNYKEGDELILVLSDTGEWMRSIHLNGRDLNKAI